MALERRDRRRRHSLASRVAIDPVAELGPAVTVRQLEGGGADELGIRSARLRIAVENVASRRLALALGYELTGPDDDPCKGLETVSYVKSLASS